MYLCWGNKVVKNDVHKYDKLDEFELLIYSFKYLCVEVELNLYLLSYGFCFVLIF